MGVSTNFLTYYGLRFEWDDAFHEAYDEAYDRLKVDIVMDGMGGEYIVMGHKLYDSGDYRWDWEGGTGDVTIGPDELAAIERAYKATFIEQFPDFGHLMKNPFEIVCFAHYS